MYKDQNRRKSAKLIHDTKGYSLEYEDLLTVLKEMIGGTIIDTGFIKESEGGLTIDFVKNGKNMRFVMGYNDLGEWVKYFGEK